MWDMQWRCCESRVFCLQQKPLDCKAEKHWSAAEIHKCSACLQTDRGFVSHSIQGSLLKAALDGASVNPAV